jgi:hypothetical protein
MSSKTEIKLKRLRLVFFCLNVLDGKTVYREGKKYLRMQNINHFLRSTYFIIFVGLYCDIYDNGNIYGVIVETDIP